MNKMQTPIIENWFIVSNGSPYLAPELWSQSMCGNVYGRNPKFDDGDPITTTRIVNAYEENGETFIITKSGSQYKLGKIQDGYEEVYPDARNRLIKSGK